MKEPEIGNIIHLDKKTKEKYQVISVINGIPLLKRYCGGLTVTMRTTETLH